MADTFESEKNLKATGYTALILTLLMIILLYVSWTLPVVPPVVTLDSMEVNLGNSDKGMGTDQPYLPGQPSAADKEKYTPPKQAVVEKEPLKDVETDDKNKEAAPVVKKPIVTKPDATKIPDKEVVKKAVRPVKRPDPIPAPPKPPHPKATMGKVTSTGTGGNDADDYKPGGSEGIAGGKGDQGAPGGDPNSKNYSGGGGHGNSGVTISRGLGGRHIVRTPIFTDDFNENNKVAIDVHVDENGNVTSADYDMRGSTTSVGNLIAIAKRKAMQVKFSSGSDESVGTIVFNFKIHS